MHFAMNGERLTFCREKKYINKSKCWNLFRFPCRHTFRSSKKKVGTTKRKTENRFLLLSILCGTFYENTIEKGNYVLDIFMWWRYYGIHCMKEHSRFLFFLSCFRCIYLLECILQRPAGKTTIKASERTMSLCDNINKENKILFHLMKWLLRRVLELETII